MMETERKSEVCEAAPQNEVWKANLDKLRTLDSQLDEACGLPDEIGENEGVGGAEKIDQMDGSHDKEETKDAKQPESGTKPDVGRTERGMDSIAGQEQKTEQGAESEKSIRDKIKEGSKATEEYRKEQGYGKSAPESGNTVAVIKDRSKSYYGENSSISPESQQETRERRDRYRREVSYSPPKKSEPKHLGAVQSLLHAESDALTKMADEYKKNGKEMPTKLEMYVDRKTCNMCRGEIPSLLKYLGVETLTIYSKDTKTPITISAKA